MKFEARDASAGVSPMRRNYQQALYVLMAIAGLVLFTRSFRNLIAADTGLRSDGLLVVNVFFRDQDYPAGDARFGVFRPLEDELRALPGVAAVARASSPPLSGAFADSRLKVNGEIVGKTNYSLVSSGYFQASGTRLLDGRDFNAQDLRGAPAVAIASEAFVRAYLNDDKSPIGRIVAFPGFRPELPDNVYRIIGVAQDSTYYNVKDTFAPLLFLAESQQTWVDLARRHMVRSSVPPETLMRSINARLAAVDPNATVRYAMFNTQIEESLRREALMARLSGIFGILAIALAVVGMYGLTAYTVTRRTSEIGIRLALGATRGHILSMLIRELSGLLAIGLAAGLALVLLLGRSVRTVLYGLDPSETVTIVLAMFVLIAAAGVAAFVPARRAVQIDAGQSLRSL